MCCGHRVLTTRACDAGTKGGSQLSYCETVLNSAFFVTVPFLRIDQDGLDEALKTTPEGGVANVEYTLEDAQGVIAGTN